MKTTAVPHPRSRKSQLGFTLLELLTVIAIIGILAAIALPALSGIRTRARIAATKAQLEQIEKALETYYGDWDTYPPMGNDYLGEYFFPSEDVGTDGVGPFSGNGLVNDGTGGRPLYTGPDSNGTEGNYELDPGEDIGLDLQSGTSDIGEGNGRLDGTYYDRMSMFADEDKASLIDFFSSRGAYYHYYAGHVRGKTNLGMPKFRSYANLANYMNTAPTYYNKWVLYSVGLDGKDHGLHNYYLVMQDGEDVGADAFASDPSDEDGDGILFEPSSGENNNTSQVTVAITIVETGWTTPGGMDEQDAPAGAAASLDGPRGKPVFSHDVRAERKREAAVYAMPDGDPVAFGVIMRYGP